MSSCLKSQQLEVKSPEHNRHITICFQYNKTISRYRFFWRILPIILTTDADVFSSGNFPLIFGGVIV